MVTFFQGHEVWLHIFDANRGNAICSESYCIGTVLPGALCRDCFSGACKLRFRIA